MIIFCTALETHYFNNRDKKVCDPHSNGSCDVGAVSLETARLIACQVLGGQEGPEDQAITYIDKPSLRMNPL